MVLWLPLTSGSLPIPTTPVTRYFWWVIEAERAFKKWCRAFYFLAFFLWLQHLTECCLLNISVYCVLCTVPVSFSWSPDCTHAFYYKTGIMSFKNRRVLCKEHENVCYVLQLMFVSIFSNNKKKNCFVFIKKCPLVRFQNSFVLANANAILIEHWALIEHFGEEAKLSSFSAIITT